ncbi:hypothetical protein IFM89_006191 [Coptis chinensis]|uniref:FAF domain-containing protein n=1 Tax=Coptis chinensis TaxID=261450 RepID=A0A835H907_9MAGN|nr:hypothetical protein IFM89_006191 [Coptis chinensis]
MSTAVNMNVSNELQGIGSILGSSKYERSKTMRRTLSADMSSKKWLVQNGFSPLKRIASSEEFQVSSDGDSPIWNSKKEKEPPGQSDIWNSIVSQKSSPLATPYVHPLAKRARSLSKRSLEICTESLGSETGSDGFSSPPPSETSDEEREEEQEEEKETPAVVKQEMGGVMKYSSHAVKKPSSRSFPPPLPSLCQSGIHMRSHRKDGRLVLEAVPTPAPSQSYFQAQREGGRLLLTFVNPKCNETTNTENTKESTEENCNLKITIQKYEEDEEAAMFEDEEEYEFESEEDEDDESASEGVEEEQEQVMMDRGTVLETKLSQPTNKLPTGVISVHRSALMANKQLAGLTNRDPTWSPKLEMNIGTEETPFAQSLPPPPLVSRLTPSSAASSFNTYDYCWRTKAVAPPTAVCTPHPLTQQLPPINKHNKFIVHKNINPQANQELVLMRGNNADYLVPSVKGCKEPRRSLIMWEPYCIATS